MATIIMMTAAPVNATEASPDSDDGDVVAILIPQENGEAVFIEGPAAAQAYEEIIAQFQMKEQQNRADEIFLNQEAVNSANSSPSGIRARMLTYKYRYIEKSRDNKYLYSSQKKRITPELKNETSINQEHEFSINVSSAWSINGEITGKFKDAVIGKLGGSWEKSFNVNRTFLMKIPSRSKIWMEFTPYYRKSSGLSQKYYNVRGPIGTEVVVKSVSVTTYSPQSINMAFGSKQMSVPDGLYVWKEVKF
jgi:hypothetical protein